MSVLEKLGQDPQRSMQRFLCGLGLFALGALAIALGYYQHHFWQIIGIILLVIGSIIAIVGYVGIFANRLYHIFNRAKR